VCPSVPAAFRSRPGLRFDTPEESADRPTSGEGVSEVSARSPDVPGRCLKPGRVVRDLRRSVRGSVRVLNLDVQEKVEEERKA
jgi:hypothetical protein